MGLIAPISAKAPDVRAREQANVELTIQDIVLTGISVQDSQALKQTISAELSRLFQVQGVSAALMNAEHRPIIKGALPPLPATSTDRLGVEIAQAIYRGLGG